MPIIILEENILSITNLKLQNSFSNSSQLKNLPPAPRTILRYVNAPETPSLQ
jgi:hypothetical protein